MSIFKAVKMEVLILTEAGMTNEEVKRWTHDALKDYADFTEVIVKILESHESVIADVHEEIQA